ncbi:aromatic acid exporter family protein [Microbacterium insulae]|uniref:Aromatic acid exporter family protein n=1 Tax=Microbacterium insulae TaxID=483014 RepID=A0ABW3AJT2_9MICO
MSAGRADQGGAGSPPTTTAVPTGWRARLSPRPALVRVRDSAIPILQIVVAATGAYAFAHYVLGHPAPLLAATVTVGSLGLVRDARPRRVLETVLGMLVGILVAELLLLLTGTGWWQLALALGLTLVVARLLSPQPAFAIAAAIQSLIVMVIPATAPFLRLVDGVIGGIAALLVTALIPRNPLRDALREGRALFAAVERTSATLTQALRRGDRLRAERGLEKARSLQPLLDEWRTSLESGIAIARISPFLRRQRFELARQDRIREAAELATRNLRVVARRVVYLCDDGKSRPVAADLLAEIVRGAGFVSDSLDDISLEPAARSALAAVASRLDPAELLPGASLGDQNLITALRPLAVDLLVATGMSPQEARTVVPRI